MTKQDKRADKILFARGIWHGFSSMRLGLVLLLLVAAVSIAGTVIPQNQPLGTYPPALVGIYQSLGLLDMYHAWWFQLLLFLLAMNLAICSLNRFGPLWKLYKSPGVHSCEQYVRGLSLQSKQTAWMAGPEAGARIGAIMKKEGYQVNSRSEGQSVYLHGDRGRIGLWGAYITHLAFLIILIGAVVSMYFSAEGSIAADVGSQFSLAEVGGLEEPDPSFQVKVEDFETAYRPDGSIAQWYSTLKVMEGDREVLTKRISVNDPLKYKGYRLYQAFYGSEIQMSVSVNPKEQPRQYTVREKEPIPIAGTDLIVVPYKYVPDYDPTLGLQSKSNEANNPRIIYLVFQGNEQIGNGAAQIGVPEALGKTETQLLFQNYTAYTGLQIRKDPGVPVVWSGCAMLMSGLFIAFYVPHRRIWIIVEGMNGVSSVLMGGLTAKNKIAFEAEFKKLSDAVKITIENDGN